MITTNTKAGDKVQLRQVENGEIIIEYLVKLRDRTWLPYEEILLSEEQAEIAYKLLKKHFKTRD